MVPKSRRLRILVIGSGGREHALAWRLASSPSVDVVHVAPGNGGTDGDEKIININIGVHRDNFPALVAHARQNGLNLVVVGPEAPLVDGIQSFFKAVGIPCFGPSQEAAMMEGSKTFSKDFMHRNGIPTAQYQNFTDYEAARKYVEGVHHDVVIKASGLAAGKGVIIPTTKQEAYDALEMIMVKKEFKDAGDEVVVEEFLEGEELSVLTFCDGYTIRSLPPAQDHKRALDGDQGPNTGGMGAYAPTKLATPELIGKIDSDIVQPTIDAMRNERMPFRGMLFTGLMITKDGPKVLEYNVRGGDPETQTLLPLLSDDTDLAEVMLACAEGWLDSVTLKVKPGASATVVACAEGYPGSYAKNRKIHLSKTAAETHIFHAGTIRDDKGLWSVGGRVIASTATGADLEEAVAKAYKGMETIKFEGMHFRKDIAHRAFSAQKTRRESDAPLTYAAAGVSIDAGNSMVQRIKKLVKETARPGADGEIGGFGGAFDMSKLGQANWPTIVSACDGVGTKLKVAFATGIHETVGIDLVAMSVNDLVVQGAEPLAFLDTFTCSNLDVDVAVDFVKGVAAGCKQSGCTLVGGETAEMPGLLANNEYDAVGTAWGYVDTGHGKKVLPDMASMVEDDVLLGLASNGLHSNGFSLVRKIIDRKHLSWETGAPWDLNTTVGKSVLSPTRIYVKPLLEVIRKDFVKGMSHITGGGLIENVPRMLPKHLSAEIDVGTWERPVVFRWLQEAGKVSLEEMSRTFNNGIGMVLVVSNIAYGEVTRILEAQGETVFKIGKLVIRAENDGCTLMNLDKWSSSSGNGRK
ncbi:Bifunctional purine biosynthetic protein ADE1 [Neophaeococcomyces mojaviensis]|uniref:Bifunctional purine biosynthetic protein ADE1 n=1 Tax=Neophaeococcomyces mojaviensis TaxID=3383035 RepID=A0ACC3AIV4_9EURO|nr:Bifunctional purine biosynthetic protein ADE1 [Knufia sp. JES_112]